MQAVAVQLIDGRGLSIIEAAALLKKPPQAVGSWYCTAKRYRPPEQFTLFSEIRNSRPVLLDG